MSPMPHQAFAKDFRWASIKHRFLGDVNLFHDRAHEGEMLIGGDNAVRLNSPEHQNVQDSKAFAYALWWAPLRV